MIGKITGIVDYIGEDHVLIETAGVGYILYAAPGTLATLPEPGSVASLYTELLVREDLLQLIGFRTLAEREWHRLLTTVQGVGAKASLSILDTLGPEGVSRAIALGDTTAIRSAQGVGPKLAARIANELVDKAPGVMALGARASRQATPRTGATPRAAAAAAPTEAEMTASVSAAAMADALSALVNLGYDRSEAARTVAEAARDAEAATAEVLIKAALQALARSL
jgi:holliday junction DNA helicase RuvA